MDSKERRDLWFLCCGFPLLAGLLLVIEVTQKDIVRGWLDVGVPLLPSPILGVIGLGASLVMLFRKHYAPAACGLVLGALFIVTFVLLRPWAA